MRKIVLKVIPGDGIGIEVVDAGKKVLRAIAALHGGIEFQLDELDWGCQYYLKHREMMPGDGLKILSDCDGILLGAIGSPRVPDHISLHGLILPVRQAFDQYINLRPIKLLKGLNSPLKIQDVRDIDFVVIRENSEGEYCGKGYVKDPGTPDETAVQEAWFSRKGTFRAIHYAFEYALRNNQKRVISATKSNALNYSMVLWDQIFDEVKSHYPGLETRSIHIDALAGLFILKPHLLEVVVASNLFGDILTDLGSAMLGSIGISPSANLNPENKHPSMFEPIHGSAPDIAGQGIANPLGTIWAIALMLEHLNLAESQNLLMQAMSAVVEEGTVRTPDLGGHHTTIEVTEAIIGKLQALS